MINCYSCGADKEEDYAAFDLYVDNTFSDDPLYAYAAIDGVCKDCAEENPLLRRKVPLSPMVNQIRHQIMAEKERNRITAEVSRQKAAVMSIEDPNTREYTLEVSSPGLELTSIVKRLEIASDVLDMRLKEGLKDYYDVARSFQEEKVRVRKLKNFLGLSTPVDAGTEELQEALRTVVFYCTTEEEFATWRAKEFPKSVAPRAWYKLTGIAKRFEIARDVLDIRLKDGLKDYFDVLSSFQEEEVRVCKLKNTIGFPTGAYARTEQLQTALRTVIRSFRKHLPNRNRSTASRAWHNR